MPPTGAIYVLTEYQGRGEPHTYIYDAEYFESLVRSTLFQSSVSKILIGTYVGNRARWTTQTLNPYRIPIPPPRTQRRNREAMRYMI